MPEVGKQEYHSKSSMYHVCSRMVHAMIPPSIYVNDDLDFEEDNEIAGSSNLSSALDKLYSWEKKLYDEVKDEEKMRLLLVKNSKRLQVLIERGAEPYKIDSTRNFIWKLSTEIRIAIQVIDSISKTINKLRDEELWPLITTLIQGFVRMWRVMLDCHRVQSQAISEAKYLDLDASGNKTADASMQLEIELMKWMIDFSCWVNAQRNYVKALNGWLSLCLHYEPEETADGVPPYSPGRIGAPPVFVICNIWSQAVDWVSEREVIDAMQALAAKVRHVSEQQSFEQQHEWMIAIRERERWIKAMEKKMQEIHKEVDALTGKLARVPGQKIGLPLHGHEREGHTHEASSDLQIGLRHLLGALENFSATSLQLYDELYKHAEEKRLSQVYAKLS